MMDLIERVCFEPPYSLLLLMSSSASGRIVADLFCKLPAINSSDIVSRKAKQVQGVGNGCALYLKLKLPLSDFHPGIKYAAAECVFTS